MTEFLKPNDSNNGQAGVKVGGESRVKGRNKYLIK